MDDATITSNQDGGFGDRAGEHLQMERGRFDAWMHVVFGYLLLVLAFTGIVLFTVTVVVAIVAAKPACARSAS